MIRAFRELTRSGRDAGIIRDIDLQKRHVAALLPISAAALRPASRLRAPTNT